MTRSLEDQLRRLGDDADRDAAQLSSDRVTHLPAPGTDGADTSEPSGRLEPSASRPRRWKLALVAAAAVALITVVGTQLRNGEPVDQLATTSQPDSPMPGSSDDADNGWAELRWCESTGDYAADSGNSFYGAYQFTQTNWDLAVAGAGAPTWVGANPAGAPVLVQDAAAAWLYNERGAEPWPVCGRYLTGPMYTPAIARWLPRADTQSERLIVFMDPSATQEEIASMQTMLDDELWTRESSRFVDQASTLVEFTSQFESNPQMLASVEAEDLPSSFRVQTARRQAGLVELQRTLQRQPGVFEVVLGRDQVAARLLIPALELDVPVRSDDPTGRRAASQLPQQTSAGMVTRITVPQGDLLFGSAIGPEAPFEGLSSLSEGDELIVERVDAPLDYNVTVTRYLVTSTQISQVDEADEIEPQQNGLLLAADVAGDPTKRLLVSARAVRLDPADYGLATFG